MDPLKRDLIEAADTITVMKQHSQKIISNIERLKKLQQNPTIDINTKECFSHEKLVTQPGLV